jgi:hypothetical protein
MADVKRPLQFFTTEALRREAKILEEKIYNAWMRLRTKPKSVGRDRIKKWSAILHLIEEELETRRR